MGTVQELTDQMWSSRNFLANVKSEDGKYLTASCGYRGNIATQEVDNEFAKMYKRKAFLHWYKGEGMDEMEFQEADKNVRDLITEYQDKQDAVVDLDGDEDEESEEDEDGDEEE